MEASLSAPPSVLVLPALKRCSKRCLPKSFLFPLCLGLQYLQYAPFACVAPDDACGCLPCRCA
eukprot:6213198-Pleurochrysis_carterae.AAC.7